jgi:hypothetical protein
MGADPMASPEQLDLAPPRWLAVEASGAFRAYRLASATADEEEELPSCHNPSFACFHQLQLMAFMTPEIAVSMLRGSAAAEGHMVHLSKMVLQG